MSYFSAIVVPTMLSGSWCSMALRRSSILDYVASEPVRFRTATTGSSMSRVRIGSDSVTPDRPPVAAVHALGDLERGALEPW